MKKFGLATAIASGRPPPCSAWQAPRQAGVDHLGWLNDIQHQVSVPQVDTSVQHSR